MNMFFIILFSMLAYVAIVGTIDLFKQINKMK